MSPIAEYNKSVTFFYCHTSVLPDFGNYLEIITPLVIDIGKRIADMIEHMLYIKNICAMKFLLNIVLHGLKCVLLCFDSDSTLDK